MARTASAVLAALIAAAPVVAAAQTATDSTTPPVVAPGATAPAEGAADAAAAAATEAAGAAEKAADAGADAAAKADDAATAATEAAETAPAADAAAAEAAKTDAAPATGDAAATPAPAADAATPAPAADAATPAPAADAAPAAGAAPAAPAEGQVGSYYTKSTHDAWTLRCLKTQDGKDPCELYQLMKDPNGKPVAEVSVIPFSGKAVAITNFVAPLETDLEAGLGLQIDSGKEARYPFMVCAPVGCVSRIGLTESELGTLKKGTKATVSLLPFGADPAKDLVKLDMSLKGFTAGFDAVQAAVKAEQQ